MSDYDDYDYDNYNYEQSMEVEDNDEIEIENNFNRADDEWRNNPEEAIQLFTKVIEKEHAKALDQRKWSFKSLTRLILMGIQKENCDLGLLQTHIQGFLELLNRQFKSEGDQALKNVVDSLMNSTNPQLMSNILPSLLDQLKNMNQISVYCSASMKMCKDYYNKKNAQKLKETINSVEKCIQSSNIQDEDRKKSFIAELLAYKVLYFTMIKQFVQIKVIYRQLLKANTDLLEPYIIGVINMTIGQQRAFERQYEHSRKKLMDAFYNFQDASSPEAKQALIYGSVVSILENFKMNLFDDMRSKVYDHDPDVQLFKELRAAYEQQNVQAFSTIINSDVFQSDSFLSQLKPNMQQIIVECKILRYSKCYRTIKLDYLAKQLMIDLSVLQKYIQGLITKKQLNGLIDEIGGYIEMRHEVTESQTNALKILVDQIKTLDIS